MISKEADYILAAKGNQPQLLEDIKDEFRFSKQIIIIIIIIIIDTNQDLEHGRIETRTCSVITNFQFIKKDTHWKSLHSIIRIQSTRKFKTVIIKLKSQHNITVLLNLKACNKTY